MHDQQTTVTMSHRMVEVLERRSADLLEAWTALVLASPSFEATSTRGVDVKNSCRDVLAALVPALGGPWDAAAASFDETRRILSALSHQRALEGWPPSATAVAVLSLKQAVLSVLASEPGWGQLLYDASCALQDLVDDFALLTFETYVSGREETIRRQQTELLELSTPVVRLWEGILAVPLIGTLDSNRSSVVMENLLEGIVETGATIAIIDITGVATVDTLVAQHLIKTVAATRLMGADCIISGIRPQIAQTIVHLGVDLTDVTTKATLASALAEAMRRIGTTVSSAAGAVPSPAAVPPGLLVGS